MKTTSTLKKHLNQCLELPIQLTVYVLVAVLVTTGTIVHKITKRSLE